MAKRSTPAEPWLFEDAAPPPPVQAAPPPPATVDLAASLSPLVHLGTSWWAFPGWNRLVFAAAHTESELARHGLHAYAGHPLFRTVGLDRAFYRPLREEEYAQLSRHVPPGFRFVVKAFQGLTRPIADERGRTHGSTSSLGTQTANPVFLDPNYALDQVIGPASRGLGAAAGPIVFQFPPLRFGKRQRVGTISKFLDALGEFLARLPKDPLVTIELRNAEVLEKHSPEYVKAVAGNGCLHGFAWHPSMPPIDRQRELLGQAGMDPCQRPLSVRWLLRHELDYADASEEFTPFDRIVRADEAARSQIASLVEAATALGNPAFIIVNNKAEGSAPLTVERLARLIASRGTASPDAPPPPQG